MNNVSMESSLSDNNDTDYTNNPDINADTPVFRIDDRQRIVAGICYLVASALGITGNSFVILSVFASKKLWSTNNIFVVNLSVADLITSISILGSVVTTLSSVDIEYPIPDWLCAAASTGVSTTFGCSVYTLASIAINRVDGIIRPMKIYKVNYTFWISLWVFTTWLIPLLGTIVPPILDIGQLGTNEYWRTCATKVHHPRLELQGYIQILVFYPVPLTVICICYTTIFFYLARHTSDIAKTISGGDDSARAMAMVIYMRKRQITVTKNMFYVVAIFIVFLVPYGLWVAFDLKDAEDAILYISTLVVFNSCVNPILYGLKHPTFKCVFKHLLSGNWEAVPEQSKAFKMIRTRSCK